MMDREKLIEHLHAGHYSCVIENRYGLHFFSQRGVADLYELYRHRPEYLSGAHMADKVVGKGAAALMVLGGIASLYADVISTPALALLRKAGIDVHFGQEVPRIENRTKTGGCPLETACIDLDDAVKIYPVIQEFMAGHSPLGQKVSMEVPQESSERN